MSEANLSPEPQEAAKDPIWRDLLERMIREGADYGKKYPIEFFEEGLREQRGTTAFKFAMAEVMAGLRANSRPLVLTERGQQGAGFMILSAAGNIGWLEQRLRTVLTYSRESVWVASNTPRELLSGREAAQMDSLEAKAAARIAMIIRADQKMAKRLGGMTTKLSG